MSCWFVSVTDVGLLLAADGWVRPLMFGGAPYASRRIGSVMDVGLLAAADAWGGPSCVVLGDEGCRIVARR